MRSNTTEHDACGIGAIVNIDGRKDHSLIDQALTIVERLDHRAGKDASGKVGDGVGILLQISHRFFSKAAFQEGFTLPMTMELRCYFCHKRHQKDLRKKNN